jgi:hypothetical protein
VVVLHLLFDASFYRGVFTPHPGRIQAISHIQKLFSLFLKDAAISNVFTYSPLNRLSVGGSFRTKNCKPKNYLSTMSYQNISATVAEADVQAIKAALATIQQKLPFLITLTPDGRKAIFKTGPNSLFFVQNALQAALNNPDIFPKSFDVAEFGADVELFAVLTDIGTTVQQLASEIDDTRMAVGGETMKEAMQVYNYVKTAAAIIPGLKPVVDQLGQRFQKTGPAQPAPATATTTATAKG